VYDIDLLRRIALESRSISAIDTLANGLVSRAIFNDMRIRAGDTDDVRVVAARFDRTRVVRAVALHDAVMGAPGADRADEVTRELSAAITAFRLREPGAQPDLDPREFAWYLATTPERAGTQRDLLQLREALAALQSVGLTETEWSETSRRILLRLAPPSAAYDLDMLVRILDSAGTPAMLARR
jgi:hypothetical protein